MLLLIDVLHVLKINLLMHDDEKWSNMGLVLKGLKLTIKTPITLSCFVYCSNWPIIISSNNLLSSITEMKPYNDNN